MENGFNVRAKRVFRVYACVVQFYDASFDELLVENEEKTIHDRNLQMLMIEVYKFLNHQNPSILWELLARKELNCSLRIKDTHFLRH